MFKIVKSKLTGKSWLVDSEGKRISEKFKAINIVVKDNYTWVEFKVKVEDELYKYYSHIGNYREESKSILFHASKGIILEGLPAQRPVRKLSDKLYMQGLNNGSVTLYDACGNLVKEYNGLYLLKDKYITYKDEKTEKWGVVDYELNQIIPPISLTSINISLFGYFVIKPDAKTMELFNTEGKFVSRIYNCNNLTFISEGLILVEYEKQYRVADLKGERVIFKSFSRVYYDKGYIVANDGSGFGVYDLKGKTVLEHGYDMVTIYRSKIIARKTTEIEI